MKKGDIFVTPDGDLIEVRRCGYGWADIKVTQPHGASWTKRQPLVNGELSFKAVQCFHELVLMIVSEVPELPALPTKLGGVPVIDSRTPHKTPASTGAGCSDERGRKYD